MTTFVEMYHPALPGTPHVLAPLQAEDLYAAKGWLAVNGSTPAPVAEFITPLAGDLRYVQHWQPSLAVTAGALFVAPDGQPIQRIANGTTRATYDATEQALWTAALKAAFATKYTSLLRAVPRDLSAVYTLSSASPTITVTADPQPGSNPATTISGGIHHAPKPVASGSRSGQSVDIDGDAAFRYVGTPSLKYGSISPDFNYVTTPLLTGGTAQAAHWAASARFWHDGQVIEIPFKAVQTSYSYRLKVDGRYVTETVQTITQTSLGVGLAAGSTYSLKFDFGTSAPRLIEFQFAENTFGGVFTEPTATLSKGPKSRFTLMGFGDSITGGANGIGRTDTYVKRLADLLGCDEFSNAAIGGTGFFAGQGSSGDYRSRIGDIVSLAPDILVISGGQNDGAQTNAAMQAEVQYVLGQIQAQSPKTLIFMWGEYAPGNPTTARMGFDAAEAAACAASGVPYISMVDPTGVAATAPAWAASTTYPNGFVVLNGGVPYANVVPGSAASFTASSWRATSWFFGTGKVGATTGDGNADRYISSDGIHPTQAGHQFIERKLAAGIVRAVRGLLPTTTWA